MKKFFKKIAMALGLSKKSEKHMVWAILLKRKPELTNVNEVGETYICSSPFGTEYEALRHKESLEADGDFNGFDIIDVVSMETSAPVSVVKYDYTISEEHPKITVEYEEL